jgi:hypothetical protein
VVGDKAHELRLLGGAWEVDVVGDEDGAQARDGNAAGVKALLEIVVGVSHRE